MKSLYFAALASLAQATKYIIKHDTTFDVSSIFDEWQKLQSSSSSNVQSASSKTPYFQSFNCSDIFSGLALDVDDLDAPTLAHLNGVVKVWTIDDYLDDPLLQPSSDNEELLKAPPEDYSVHQWTGVDKLHKAGVRGRGATVAVIDTGIDYTHEALGGCFGPGCKVIGGYDLLSGTTKGAVLSATPDSDPMDMFGHGTHVAGIIAGESETFTGVAPDARLLAYKNNDGQGVRATELIQATCDAYGAGADIISTSVNGPYGFSDGPWAAVASRIVEKGVVIVIAAGNLGLNGPFASGGGSNGLGVLSASAISVNTNSTISVDTEAAQPQPAWYTSWGPTSELLIKPDVGAPGSRIFSTWLNQTYKPLDGTSMATPYLAGVAALYISAHGGREIHGPGFARSLTDQIISSGRSIPWSDKNSTIMAPPFQVGTGLVDAQRVLNSTTHIWAPPMALQDLVYFRPDWTIKITNNANETVEYTFEQEPQAAFEIHGGKVHSGIHNYVALQPTHIAPGVELPPATKVKPGETVSLPVKFSPPKDVDDDYLPIYGGKIWIKGSNGESLCVAYAGTAYDTEKAFDTMFRVEPRIADVRPAWSFNMDENPKDFVALSVAMAYPCYHFRWDIYQAGWNEVLWAYPPQVGQYGYIGSAKAYRPLGLREKATSFHVNRTVPFPLKRLPRGNAWFWWFGMLANGTRIAPGNYTMRVAALRPHGNPDLTDHWHIARLNVPTLTVSPFEKDDKTKIKEAKEKKKEMKEAQEKKEKEAKKKEKKAKKKEKEAKKKQKEDKKKQKELKKAEKKKQKKDKKKEKELKRVEKKMKETIKEAKKGEKEDEVMKEHEEKRKEIEEFEDSEMEMGEQ